MADLPPRDAPDLWNRNQQNRPNNPQQPGNPQQGNPQGGGQQPYGQGQPQQGNYDNYPPQQPQQGNYGNYPPQQPRGLDPAAPPSLGGQGQQQSYGGQQQPNYGEQGGLQSNQAPNLARQSMQDYQGAVNTGLPPAELPTINKGGDSTNALGLPSIAEHRIEYLSWGLTVCLFGFSVILLIIDTSIAGLVATVVTPILAGLILLTGALVQRIVMNYSVSLFTWGVANFSLAFGGAQVIRRLADTGFVPTLVSFIGLLIVISGMVMILQVFSRN